jgi:two-component system nitrate/nitrite sensor histidine kinase NarX
MTVMDKLWSALARRALLPWLGLAMFVIIAIGVMGMATSVMVAETVQGSGSAINVAGSLRKQSHLMGSLVLSDAENRAESHGRLLVAMNQFEESLANDALRKALARDGDSTAADTYQSVLQTWKLRLKPQLLDEAAPGIDPHDTAHHNALLALIDDFVNEINTMVAQLEADTEARIRNLRTILAVALVLTIVVALAVLAVVRRRVMRPLGDLLKSADRLARGDFQARVRHIGEDELGQVGQTFNFMADELTKLYRGLEQRVAEKTLELTRSNRSLELLYHSITRLHDAPLSPESYRAMLCEIDQALGLAGSMVCLLSPHDQPASVLASTLSGCPSREAGQCPCHAACPDAAGQTQYWQEGELSTRFLALRDVERQYGVLKLALPSGRQLEPWQDQLVEALAQHIGIALGISHKTEQERLLALQEERSVIARELHDSIAQALSYMKIQVSLLQPVLSDPGRQAEATVILRDLREGITAAYRQLRELLATFRLKMEGDFLDLLEKTVSEYGQRGGIPVHLIAELAGCRLSPNQEIHTLQIVREALSNMLRHARAKEAWVRIQHDGGQVTVCVEDDGIGLARIPSQPEPHHYGLAIMQERAASLHGTIDVSKRAEGGTIVCLRFQAQPIESGLPTTNRTEEDQNA